ncbi:FHS family L-fucose permease-like MFS transporter [Sphingomonas vulcanisoli]|uniref:FHS family L-fucose permease-like MFS transporter n=1 Tax=Sphingomonas vulcanisoli TaxID=1658060 RepID=A0ABX0TTL1_9SPHN|nr:sugar MFS transporter [Sphingomonas vulcanisoli]NIJ06941.1 FHS family L-fucose permease-like MFS transporter [Sphingomonas vulcanisoli]
MAFESAPAVEETAGEGRNIAGLRIAVLVLFFLFGGITSLNDVLIPKLKGLFSLDYREAMLVQSAFFGAYFIVSFPAGLLVQRIGYLRAAVVGLATMAAGCLLFVPASASGAFPTFLGALFVVAAGITIVQVVANPLISALGKPETASSRLTFAQAFNSLGTTIMPWIGASLILGSISKAAPPSEPGALAIFRAAEAHIIGHAYVGIAIVLLMVAGAIWIGRNAYAGGRGPAAKLGEAIGLLKRRRFAFGSVCIFLYVGAEVSIGSLLASYLMQPRTMGFDPETAGKYISYYWGGAMIGRFVGAAVLQKARPPVVLTTVASAAIILLLLSANLSGPIAGWALLLVGTMNAIQFPTIFSLASERLGERAAEGSGLICMAIVGGAIVPLITGAAADRVGLGTALSVPALCYAVIAAFGLYARRPAPPLETPA